MIRKKIDQSDHRIVMTTEKDAVKLREWFTEEDPVWFLTIDMEFMAGEHHIHQLLDRAGFV